MTAAGDPRARRATAGASARGRSAAELAASAQMVRRAIKFVFMARRDGGKKATAAWGARQ